MPTEKPNQAPPAAGALLGSESVRVDEPLTLSDGDACIQDATAALGQRRGSKPWMPNSVEEYQRVELGPLTLAALNEIALALQRRDDKENANGELPDSQPAAQTAEASLEQLLGRLGAMEDGIRELLKAGRRANDAEKSWYAVREAAERLDYSEWTIRNACSGGRIKAEKGPDGWWRISRDELVNIQNHGLPKKPDAK